MEQNVAGGRYLIKSVMQFAVLEAVDAVVKVHREESRIPLSTILRRISSLKSMIFFIEYFPTLPSLVPLLPQWPLSQQSSVKTTCQSGMSSLKAGF